METERNILDAWVNLLKLKIKVAGWMKFFIKMTQEDLKRFIVRWTSCYLKQFYQQEFLYVDT